MIARIRRGLVAGMGAGILMGLMGLPGCSGGGEGTTPESKGRRDEIQKARELGNSGGSPAAKGPGAR